jgi:hypothetical protein
VIFWSHDQSHVILVKAGQMPVSMDMLAALFFQLQLQIGS